MPEGDSIRRLATRLQPLVGQTIDRVTTQGLERDLAGRRIDHIDAHGKHLLIDLDNATQIRTHLGMNGRVRLLSRAEGDARVAHTSPGRATLVVATPTHVALWLQARTVEIAARRAPRRGEAVAALGPDVLAGDFDSRQAASRAAVHTSRTIAEVLLDQRVAAGIGNIWKSESCFARGIDPRTRVGALSLDDIAGIYTAARDLMLAGLDGPRMPDRFRVYSRTNRPCTRCGTPIECYQLGDPPRWTWSCPRCQPTTADTR